MRLNFIITFLLNQIRHKYFRIIHRLRSQNAISSGDHLSGKGNNLYLFSSPVSNPLKISFSDQLHNAPCVLPCRHLAAAPDELRAALGD